jgi:hypothetical protein
MKSAIISDPHSRIELADAAVAAAGADRAIYLGDYFDDFGDTPADARRTAQWIRERMAAHPEDIWLLGNHDLPYAFGNHLYPCPGWNPAKHQEVTRILGPEHWCRMALHHWEQGWLLSHAGIARWLFPVDSNDEERNKFIVDERCRLALERARRGENDLILSAVGRSRGGRCESGGIVWQCWSEFNPIAGIRQIVGHTPSGDVRKRTRPLRERMLSGRIYVRDENPRGPIVSENWCLDTNSQHYATVEYGDVSFWRMPKGAHGSAVPLIDNH